MEQPLSEAEAAQREREGRWVLGCSVGCLVPFLLFVIAGGWFFRELAGPLDGSADSITLHVSKIRGSDSLLVHYMVWYGRDGNIVSHTVTDNLVNFNFRDVTKIPIQYFQKVSRDSIFGLTVSRARAKSPSLLPLDTTTYKSRNVTVTEIKYLGSSDYPFCLWKEYRFESFTETRDSIIFQNCTLRKSEVTVPRLAFYKGHVTVEGRVTGPISKIVLKDFVREYRDVPEWKSGEGYTGDTLRQHPVVCLQRYDFTPIESIDVDEFSDYGIFKPYPVVRTDQ